MKLKRFNDIPGNMRGGMGRYIDYVNKKLTEHGHEILSVFSEGIPCSQNGRIRRFTAPRWILRHVEDLPENERPDLVEIHEPLGAWYTYGRKKNRKLPPVLLTVYGLESRALESRIEVGNRLGKPVGILSKLGARIITGQSNYGLRHADHVLVETTEDRDWLVEHLARHPDDVTIHPGGVTDGFFKITPSYSHNVLFFGSWIERKGISVFSQVINKVMPEFPSSTVTIAGAGCSEDKIRSCFSENLQKRLIVFPTVGSDEHLIEIYQRNGIFFFPSNFEGMPLVLLEAAASGCAVISTNVCGMKDFIQDDINGLLACPADSSVFEMHLRDFLSNPIKRQRLGCAAREAARKYTWTRSARIFLDACEKTISKGKSFG